MLILTQVSFKITWPHTNFQQFPFFSSSKFEEELQEMRMMCLFV